MPHVVAVRCPACSRSARFEFAEAALIERKRDVPYFDRHPLFEYAFLQEHGGQRRHFAFFFPGHRTTSLEGVADLPDGYSASDWDHLPYQYRSHGLDIGTVSCSRCGVRRRHQLAWPTDAAFQIEYRGEVLWAFDRPSAIELRDFVASDARDPKAYRHSSLLLHVPKLFLTKKARTRVVTLMQRLLAEEE